MEEQQKEAERKQREVIARLQQRKAEKERREKELLESETKRAQEIYVSLRKVREALKKKEDDEMKKEDEAWRQQELKAQEEERRRRSSVSLARKEVMREREEAKRLSMVEGPRRSFSVKPQRPPPPVPARLVETGKESLCFWGAKLSDLFGVTAFFRAQNLSSSDSVRYLQSYANNLMLITPFLRNNVNIRVCGNVCRRYSAARNTGKEY